MVVRGLHHVEEHPYGASPYMAILPRLMTEFYCIFDDLVRPSALEATANPAAVAMLQAAVRLLEVLVSAPKADAPTPPGLGEEALQTTIVAGAIAAGTGILGSLRWAMKHW